MKKPEYVAQVVSMYRAAIDAWKQKRQLPQDVQKEWDLRKLFNRGFTKGHAFHASGRAMMNPIRPNHQGVVLGEVIAVSDRRITIRLSEDLHQGDGIRILGKEEDAGCIVNRLYKDGKLVAHAKKGRGRRDRPQDPGTQTCGGPPYERQRASAAAAPHLCGLPEGEGQRPSDAARSEKDWSAACAMKRASAWRGPVRK